MLSVRSTFRSKLETDVKQLANLLLIGNNSLASNYTDVITACLMYLTVTVTVAEAEISFSKLKLIKNFLRSLQRLSSLALSPVENDMALSVE